MREVVPQLGDGLARWTWRTPAHAPAAAVHSLTGIARRAIGAPTSSFVHREIVVLVVSARLSSSASCSPVPRLVRIAPFGFGTPVVWYNAGEHHLADGRTETAIKALRRATAISRDNRTYRVALAAALAADRQDDAARQVLLGVRELTPEDPEVNVAARATRSAS